MLLYKCLKDRNCLTINWDIVEQIPEMNRLKECQQSPKWHQEGDAWVHTQKVVEAAYVKAFDFAELQMRRKLILCALLHDIGKCNTTFMDKRKPDVWHSYNHEFESERLIKEIFQNKEEETEVEEIAKIVRNHMAVLNLLDTKTPYENIIKMVEDVNGKKNFDILVALKECDMKGSDPEDKIRQTADFLKLNEIQRIADVLYGEMVYNFKPHLKGDFDYEVYLKNHGQ